MTEPLPADLVYSFYEGEVPCTFELVSQEGCKAKSVALIRMVHRDDQSRMCGPESLEWLPFCEEHKVMIERTTSGFWAALVGTMPCINCGLAVELGSVKPL